MIEVIPDSLPSLDDLLAAMSPEDREEYLALSKTKFRSKVLLSDLYIRTKPPNVQLVPLTPNETQLLYLADIAKHCTFDPLTAEGDLEGLRLDVLKYRQWGCSTITLALYMQDTLNNPNTVTRVIAHNPKTTSDLFSIVRVMYDYVPEEKKPRIKYDSAERLQFDNGSVFSVLQVGSRGAGRGGTVKNLLLSERAFWPVDGNEIEFGLVQSVPYGGNIVRETTANGLETFYEQYKMAERGESDYKALFYGWSPHKDYSRPLPENFTPSEEELELQKLYDLTDGQIVFRREKTMEASRLGKDFRQEYPLFADEAFIASGNAYYNREFLSAYQARLSRDPLNKPLYEVHVGEQGFHGLMKVWKEPELGRLYVIGADPAGGPDYSGKNDYASAHVFDLESWEEVVTYHGRPDPWDFGMDIAALSTWYKDALVGVLRLNHGGECLRALREAGCTYLACDEDGKLGLIENTRTKPQLDDALGTIINDMARDEPGLVLHDIETVQELITYAHLGGGKAGAEGSAHDDRQSSLKAVIHLLRHDDRRYRLPQKEPMAPTTPYSITRRKR